MATINIIPVEERDLHTTRGGNVQVPYLVERDIDFAKLLAKKGSALAAGDIVQALKLPAQSVLLGVFVAKVTATNATTLTIDAGSADPDGYVDGWDAQAAAVGDIATTITPLAVAINTPTDTIDVTLATLTGTLNSGMIRVAALVLDMKKAARPGIANRVY